MHCPSTMPFRSPWFIWVGGTSSTTRQGQHPSPKQEAAFHTSVWGEWWQENQASAPLSKNYLIKNTGGLQVYEKLEYPALRRERTKGKSLPCVNTNIFYPFLFSTKIQFARQERAWLTWCRPPAFSLAGDGGNGPQKTACTEWRLDSSKEN